MIARTQLTSTMINAGMSIQGTIPGYGVGVGKSPRADAGGGAPKAIDQKTVQKNNIRLDAVSDQNCHCYRSVIITIFHLYYEINASTNM